MPSCTSLSAHSGTQASARNTAARRGHVRRSPDEPDEARAAHGDGAAGSGGTMRAPRRSPRSSPCSPRSRYSGSSRIIGRRQAQVGEAAQHQHPGPDEHVDAVLEGAHPARQGDLRQIEDDGARDAHEKAVTASRCARERSVLPRQMSAASRAKPVTNRTGGHGNALTGEDKGACSLSAVPKEDDCATFQFSKCAGLREFFANSLGVGPIERARRGAPPPCAAPSPPRLPRPSCDRRRP